MCHATACTRAPSAHAICTCPSLLLTVDLLGEWVHGHWRALSLVLVLAGLHQLGGELGDTELQALRPRACAHLSRQGTPLLSVYVQHASVAQCLCKPRAIVAQGASVAMIRRRVSIVINARIALAVLTRNPTWENARQNPCFNMYCLLVAPVVHITGDERGSVAWH
jgi:hypothetical protein